MRAEWERDIAFIAMQRDRTSPYRDMVRWRRLALAGWIAAVLLAFILVALVFPLAEVAAR